MTGFALITLRVPDRATSALSCPVPSVWGELSGGHRYTPTDRSLSSPEAESMDMDLAVIKLFFCQKI